ncbi:hypothetical protein ACP275_14G224900 [Erythranthe tilingii]
MRGRAKGKKLSVTNQDDNGSGEEEKIPVQKRRGRPQKPLKDEISDEEAQKLEDEEDSDGTTKIKNGKKRKRNNNNNATEKVKEKVETVPEEENGNGERPSNEESSKKSIGFRQNGNRRKNKPRRAAEAVVECN